MKRICSLFSLPSSDPPTTLFHTVSLEFMENHSTCILFVGVSRQSTSFSTLGGQLILVAV